MGPGQILPHQAWVGLGVMAMKEIFCTLELEPHHRIEISVIYKAPLLGVSYHSAGDTVCVFYIPVRIPYMSQIDLFENFFSIGLLDTISSFFGRSYFLEEDAADVF